MRPVGGEAFFFYQLMNKLFFYACSALLASGAALTAVSCADDDLDNGGTNGNGAVVRFSVNDVQEGAISRGVMTRGAITPGLGSSDLAGGKLTAHSNRNIDVCLIETTVEGVNPVKADAHTRANIIKTSTLGDFSASGIRGTSASTILTTPEWFHAKKTKSNGELYSPIYWAFSQPFARFFAVSPNVESYSKMTINNTATSGSPSVEFEVNTDVTKEVDLMTACSGDVQYATQNVQPITSLDFRHALTGIRFAVGQNLSWNKTIDKVELRNVLLKSKYVLSKQFNGTGAAWDHTGYSMRGTAVLSGVSVSTSASPNTTIMGNAGDNYTFYMIPQQLTGLVTAYVHCTDGTTITVPLKGEWKAGTTRTYKLSQTTSTWNYTITATNPSAAAYDQTTTDNYGITSYRTAPDGTQQAVAWKVVGYSVDGGTTYTTNKPAWLTSLSKTEGDGGTAADQGTATLTKDVADLLAKRNKALKEATALGSAGAPYDLSTKGGSVANRSTANCYVISAPGHYRIPLVYGNAIENGATNANAYISHAPTGTPNEQYVLRNFKDHAGANITDPWIEKTNGGANNGVNGAEVVWADAANLVHLSSTPISHDASSNAFLDFEVTAADIQSGNAVVAVTKGSGASKTVLWSWHLWFAPKDALDKIKVTNHQNKDYYFTKETLGWKPTQWSGSTYDKARTVKVKVEQTVANNGTKQVTVINITQNPGNVKKGATTLYQFGRKDAFPGVATSDLKAGGITENAGDNMSITNGILNPDKFYISGSNWWNNYGYYNLWSADNIVTGTYNVGNDNPVVKTVYDPCPVGFKMPANNAFTGFTTTGQNSSTQSELNVDGTDHWQQWTNNFGHNFWTNSSKTATINFPASGLRNDSDGSLLYVGYYGFYWSAVPYYTSDGCNLYFGSGNVYPLYSSTRTFGFAVRAVSE